jgi:hypothetical protein
MYCPKAEGCILTAECKACPDNSKVWTAGADNTLRQGHLATGGCGRKCYCNIGFFAVPSGADGKSIKCVACPAGADCTNPRGTFDSIASRPGWWQIKGWYGEGTKYALGELEYERCLESVQCKEAIDDIDWNLESVDPVIQAKVDANCLCIGSANYSFVSGEGCRTGHNGPYCSLCQDGWVMDQSSGVCSNCDSFSAEDNANSVFVLIGMLVLMVVLVAAVLYCFLKCKVGGEIIHVIFAVKGAFETALVVAGGGGSGLGFFGSVTLPKPNTNTYTTYGGTAVPMTDFFSKCVWCVQYRAREHRRVLGKENTYEILLCGEEGRRAEEEGGGGRGRRKGEGE